MKEGEEKAIVELLADMLHEQRIANQQLLKMDSRLEKLESQQIKTNAAIGELRLSVMRLADQLELVFQHEKRIDALEKVVFK
jgi:predicted  nucleic acid-binding Zn-ribbon protein